jgi:hypothetical protein
MSTTATAALSIGTAPRTRALPALRALLLPAAFSFTLAAVVTIPSIATKPRLVWSILGASGILLAAAMAMAAVSRGRTLLIDVQLRPQHYLQACAQGSMLLYWGYYWRPVYDALPLLLAQLLFAYAFDILLAWTRRNTYTLGFAPFPVIFSINLFLWFKPDWFYLQFLMIAVGFAAKELIRWNKEGRSAHIFNPSSFPLAVFSLALIISGATSITYGPDIAVTQFTPPHIYLFLFLIGLPGQYLFGVTTMTMSAVVTTYLFGVVYYALTGTYFFIDSYVPIAVFLGMHLLFTDPSTSPRTELGRVMFGVMYGLGNILFYEWFRQIGVPAFYDKLLPVPIMNVSIKLIDRIAKSRWLSRIDPARLAPTLTGRNRNLAYISVWTAVFVVLSVTNGLGDNHDGQRLPFWQNACVQGGRNACENVAIMLDTYCQKGSGWACNEEGALRASGRVAGQDRAMALFAQACDLKFAAGCENVASIGLRGSPKQSPPMLRDYPIVLQSGKGELEDLSPVSLLTAACADGWANGCDALGAMYLKGEGVSRDAVQAANYLAKACDGRVATACSNVGFMYYSGDGLPRDSERGLSYLQRSCELGYANGCRWLKDARGEARPQ